MSKLIILLLISLFSISNNGSKEVVKGNKPQVVKEMIGTAVYCERETEDGPCVEKVRE